jgi:uncharacterized protein with LGFP repeats
MGNERTIKAPEFAAYEASGAHSGPLGAATSNVNVYSTPNGTGQAQDFVGGYIYTIGNQTSYLKKDSGIYQTWQLLGSQNSSLGWPMTSETCTTSVCYVRFQKGYVTWRIGANAIYQVTGAQADLYATLGGPTGQLGAATGTTTSASTGTKQSFENGTIYTNAGHTTYFKQESGIYQTWLRLGAENSTLGLPLSSETCTSSVCSAEFSNGYVTWQIGSSSVYYVQPPQSAVYTNAGGPNGVLGAPTTSANRYATQNGTGAAQDFVGGYVFSTAKSNSYLRKNSAIYQTWAAQGSQWSTLGWPITDEVCTSKTCTVEFQNGDLVWNL